ncbi:pleckstrin homology-like domain family A member 3 isoform X1 [Eptesicus fuscus]|uniref:pleckstrin homology-like domain family A member 3 isoform X1 n=1 Tax=Eptesicus fuscus TaxID=29078 RepID=UPI0024040C7B|nr:pleckstrin homology-like domain family A member 3 isoform X1 [Eptesicus fuscus]
MDRLPPARPTLEIQPAPRAGALTSWVPPVWGQGAPPSITRPDPSGARSRPRPGRVQEALPLKGQVAGPGGGQRPRGAEDEDSAPGRCGAQDVPGTEPASHRADSWITGETWHRSPSRGPAICPADCCPPRLGARPEEEGRAPRGAEPQDTEASPAPRGGPPLD